MFKFIKCKICYKEQTSSHFCTNGKQTNIFPKGVLRNFLRNVQPHGRETKRGIKKKLPHSPL